MNMNPKNVASARTARLAREAATPVYSTSTASAAAALLARAERVACTEDYCFVCGRATDHFGEHSPEQILAWSRTPRARMLAGVR